MNFFDTTDTLASNAKDRPRFSFKTILYLVHFNEV